MLENCIFFSSHFLKFDAEMDLKCLTENHRPVYEHHKDVLLSVLQWFILSLFCDE